MISAVSRFVNGYGKIVGLIFLAGALYARSEFMLSSAIREIDKLSVVMDSLREETTMLRIELVKLKTEISYLRGSSRHDEPATDMNRRGK